MLIKKTLTLVFILCIALLISNFNSLAAVTDYPTMIATSLGEDASTQIHVSWHTQGGYTQIQVTHASDITYSQPIEATPVCAPYEYLPFNLEERVICRLDLENLTPGQKYRYRIGNGEEWTPSYTFQTADLSDNFSFIYIADSQASTPDQFLDLNRVVRLAMNRDPNASFIFSGGDQVDIGGEPMQFQYFFDAFPQLMQIPLMTLHGNHEAMNAGTNWREEKGETAAYDAHFYNPQNGHPDWKNSSYYFRYNQVLFIGLNTQLDSADLYNQAQWLEDVLMENEETQESQYIIIGMHRGIYGNYYFGNSTINLMNTIYRPIFDQFNVDLVLSGHDHTYSRSHRMYQNQRVDDYSDKGTIYLIGGATGPKLTYGNKEGASHLWNTRVDFIGVYTIIDFSPTKISIQAYDSNDMLIDEFYIPTKRPQAETLFKSVDFIQTLEGITLNWDASTLENVEAISIENIDGTIYDTVEPSIGSLDIELNQINATLRLRLRLHYTDKTTKFETVTVQTRRAFDVIESSSNLIHIKWDGSINPDDIGYYEVYLNGEHIDTLHRLQSEYHYINLESESSYQLTLMRYNINQVLIATESRNVQTP